MANTFKGGIHPAEEKELTAHLPFDEMPAPKEVKIPISQHIGKPSKILVSKKDVVKAGQKIAEPDGFISAVIHSPISGTVTNIGEHENVNGKSQTAITIQSDGTEDFEYMPPLDLDSVTPDEIRERVKEAGIVGQGGAAFPTYVKLSPPKDKKIDYVILNGAECEPYLTRDYRFMLERTDDLLKGLRLLMKALGVKAGRIGIENNKPEAISVLKKATEKYPDISIDVVKTKYPQGAEKMLIRAAIGRFVPPGKLPMDVGVVMQNIGTAIAVYDAVVNGLPSITAAMTVSGKGIVNPKNLIVRVGATIGEIIDYCGGMTDDARKLIVGGPMMGVSQYDTSASIMKATSGILVLAEDEVKRAEETNCVKCGNCISVCPINLMPTNLIKYAQQKRLDDLRSYGIWNCIECGSCQFNCPANIPLVQWLRLGKHIVRKDDDANKEV